MNIVDINEWTAARQHFDEYKVYTKLLPGTSQWIKFWEEERKRCLFGYHTGRDFIPGYFYDYLNYSPIMKSEEVKQEPSGLILPPTDIVVTGNVQAERIEGFPNFWDGDYDWFHYLEESEKMAEHAFLGGSRGKGKSFKAGSMLCRNYFHIEKSKSFAFAYSLEFLTGDGIITKAWDIMDFRDTYTPWGKRRHFKNTDLHRRSSYQEIDSEGLKIEKGWKSEIIGVTVGDDIDKLRGKRGKLIILEEAGNFRKLGTGWNILRPSMEDGKRTFGLILGIGTGGTEGAASAGFEELFRNPKAYRIHAVNNKWEAGRENTKCAYFWSASVNYSGAYDEKTGESHLETATNLIMEDRKLVATGSDPHALVRRKAELPLNPSEMLMRISGTQFPIGLLKEQEAEIFTKAHIYADADYICKFDLNRESQKFEFKLDFDSTPILKFPHSDNKNMPGAIVMYKKRITDEPPFGRYVAGIDSYDFDESTTTSLGSCYVADTFTGEIVAEYTGRPEAKEFYENCRRLLLYYNAQVNIENSNKGIFDYFDSKNCGYLICEELNIVREATQDNGKKTGHRRRGFTPSQPLNAYARGLIAQWLRESSNNEEKPEELRVHTFRCLPAIQEMILWNMDGNFDRVSALGALMLLYYDRTKYPIEERFKEDPIDEFFTRHFNVNSYLEIRNNSGDSNPLINF